MAGAAQAKGILEQGVERPPEEGFVAIVRSIDRWLAHIETALLTVVLLALIFFGVYQVVKPAPWIRDAVRYSVLFIGMIAGALATQSDRLFNIDMFGRLFGQRGKLVVRILTALFTIGVCWVVFNASMVLRKKITGEEGAFLSPSDGILPIPIGMLAIALHMLLHTLIDVYYLATGKPSPDVAEVAPKV